MRLVYVFYLQVIDFSTEGNLIGGGGFFKYISLPLERDCEGFGDVWYVISPSTFGHFQLPSFRLNELEFCIWAEGYFLVREYRKVG